MNNNAMHPKPRGGEALENEWANKKITSAHKKPDNGVFFCIPRI
jgi:hypothetical protein